jgi:sulfonate transport system substrate-binding protein
LTAHRAIIDFVSLHRSLTRRQQSSKTGHMSTNCHSIARRLATSLLAATTSSTAAASFAAAAAGSN